MRASRVGASVVLHARLDEVEVARALDEEGIAVMDIPWLPKDN